MPISGTPKRTEHITLLAQGYTVTDMAAALTEVFMFRVQADLSPFTQARITVAVSIAGNATAEVRLQYSTDQSTWNYLDGGTGPAVLIASTGVRTSPWITIASGARADVYLRAITINGDGVADPTFRTVTLQVR